jgi:cysteinyl-tRNA synthetase
LNLQIITKVKINQLQNRQLHALIGKLKITAEQKKEMVAGATNGRSTSAADLLKNEAQNLINHLNRLSGQQSQNKNWEAADRMRKKVLSICHEMGWELADGSVDMDRLEAFLLARGCLKKRLNDFTVNELPALVTQFENILRKHYDAR